MKTGPIAGFKAYDLRGRVPSELNEDVAYRVGRAYAEFVRPRKVIVGRDKCFIEEIRPIDTKQMKADRKLMKEQLKEAEKS